jgi:hypothetical protein
MFPKESSPKEVSRLRRDERYIVPIAQQSQHFKSTVESRSNIEKRH